MGEFLYVPLWLLFKMANVSSGTHGGVGTEEEELGRKVSGIGKVLVNSLFFFLPEKQEETKL